MTNVVIIGGGPGGYEAALVGRQLGGQVTLVEREGLGGAAVLSDCVPSKSLIATAEVLVRIENAKEIGLSIEGGRDAVRVDYAGVSERIMALARAQSEDIRERLVADGVRVVAGQARLDGPRRVIADTADGQQSFDADIVLLATGTTPRELPDARTDGERILNWKQIYSLKEVPRKLIVVGSGVTGVEFAGAMHALGAEVVLVSSRSQVLPGEDPDAAAVLQQVYTTRGMEIMSECRANAARVEGDCVVVTLSDGREVVGSHALFAVGATPNTVGLGLESAGVQMTRSGHIPVDRVSRTNVANIYAAGDVTGVFPLASVAAMQGRIAMWHSLGDAVTPLDIRQVSSNVFTSPEVATVGVTQAEVDEGKVNVATAFLSLDGNARSKMQSFRDGFVKLFCLPISGIIVGGVVVAPRASELIHAVTLAVTQRITVDQFSNTFTVYPSMSGSVAEAARRLHRRERELLTS
ncbi:NAD(P)H-quinone dehydrogenase [Tessaracoccus sp. OH4464_COT-324]|uniref:NAD(P)H-quinone dehydrogenase n=1 Tax=Tessaracoccus sp. OH4464_COT-324 TaxID=2491059 RepID=UPI000F644BD3|nr:NAD(P)H-quinone dehydrogenase [Tessaracoccus sp. OH4464_COT-324]RRD44745.1 NAD(P)H-quinone dehydrogenase [Tessaracoccus sp. OH4464_COT-324]